MNKVYVDENNRALIICPKCGFEKNVDAMKYRNPTNIVTGKCKCKETFQFSIEYRKQRYCQMLCTALGSDPVYFDTVNKLYSFNYHC